ncbi:MAG TPA: YgiQ family radical SAM protein [Planctomycetaceae bacterium]|nr:YgiQ family radical SAM protein [Blastopirellula sp.]HAY79616.1 YgiQ family radical SAM protein [Planctomycetaceae bacterium]
MQLPILENRPAPGETARELLALPVLDRDAISSKPLPMTRAEMRERQWDEVDVVFVTGDAYVDHPSMAMAILGRVLEAAGYRVAILSQPNWKSCDDWRRFGRPRLFFAISAGNMDSMINHYTANKKVRNSDAYSPGGRIGLRPDRATLSYCQRAREAYKGVPVIAGGVEASLRRLAHYDYWSDKVRRSILLDCKADLVAYGMGEDSIIEIARRLDGGETVKDLRDLRGIAYAMGASETPPSDALVLPSFAEVREDRLLFAEATKLIHNETNPYNARRLVQYHDRQAVVCNPPPLPVSQEVMDRIYGLPYTRRPHPSYQDPIPAYSTIKDSVTIMRGCFGGCTFCSITAHQGRIIQSRSKESVVNEIQQMTDDPKFSGTVSDIGGPTANMYEMKCTDPKVEAVCRRQSCVHPTICKLLGTDHAPLVQLMKEARETPGVKKVMVASGIRMDLARRSPEYMRDLVRHHVGGHLKVAPEHTDPDVLDKMRKPSNDDFEEFTEEFKKESAKAGKKQYIVPYFIASHPGSDLDSMIHLAVFLKQNGYRPDQVQDFIPAPFDVATAMYYTGIDPFTKKPVHVARHLRDRKLQRALMQFFKPENYFEVRKALEQAGRQDLIGNDCDSLIPAAAPPEALRARRKDANARFSGQYVHQVDGDKPTNKQRRNRKQSRNAPGNSYRPRSTKNSGKRKKR